ncbi:MAG: hypothetical protein JWM60_1301 [Solirubrobacterales bacterium]|nr:hypothetical protein [Solirubrobacterales bacterium]
MGQQSFEDLRISRATAEAAPGVLRFQSGRVDTLAVTGVAVRGIDADGTSHMINVDLSAHHGPYFDRAGSRRAAA